VEIRGPGGRWLYRRFYDIVIAIYLQKSISTVLLVNKFLGRGLADPSPVTVMTVMKESSKRTSSKTK